MAEQTLNDLDYRMLAEAGAAPMWLAENPGYEYQDGDEALLEKIGLDKEMPEWLTASVEAPTPAPVAEASNIPVEVTGRAPKKAEYPFKSVSREVARVDVKEQLRSAMNHLQTVGLKGAELERAMYFYNTFAVQLASEVLKSESKQ